VHIPSHRRWRGQRESAARRHLDRLGPFCRFHESLRSWPTHRETTPLRLHVATGRIYAMRAVLYKNELIIIIIHMTIFMVLSSRLRAIARVHPVHMTSADWAPDGCQPSEQASRLGLWVRRCSLLQSTSTVAICHYYSAHKADTHFTVPQRVEGWVDLGTAVKMRNPCLKLHIAEATWVAHMKRPDHSLVCSRVNSEPSWDVVGC